MGGRIFTFRFVSQAAGYVFGSQHVSLYSFAPPASSARAPGAASNDWPAQSATASESKSFESDLSSDDLMDDEDPEAHVH